MTQSRAFAACFCRAVASMLGICASMQAPIRAPCDRCILAPMLKLIVRWLLLAAALLLVAYLYPGVSVASFGAAMVAALVLGLLNTVVRPLLVLLTLPVTLVTLGLFLFVINALMFWAAAGVLDGFNVTGFGAALIGSLIYSLCGMVIDVAMERLFSGRELTAG
jgi:putative membrane protein